MTIAVFLANQLTLNIIVLEISNTQPLSWKYRLRCVYIGEEGVGKSKETGSFVGQFEWVWLRLWTWTLRRSIPQHSLVLSTDIFSLSNLSDTVTFMSKNFGFPSWIHSRRDRNLQIPKRATCDERPRQVPGSPGGVFQLFKQCNRKKGHYELVFICKTAVNHNNYPQGKANC